jgi:enamine deaminase RidA (YjgF/YER057c/UK114 family)
MSITRTGTNARMSQSVTHNGVIYLAGQVATDATDAADQTRQVLAKVVSLLTAAGSDKTKMLSATIYLKSISDFAAMNAEWDAWVPTGAAPARATVEAALALPELLVEVVVTAAA